jgi:hypothetical protein
VRRGEMIERGEKDEMPHHVETTRDEASGDARDASTSFFDFPLLLFSSLLFSPSLSSSLHLFIFIPSSSSPPHHGFEIRAVRLYESSDSSDQQHIPVAMAPVPLAPWPA